MEARIKTGQYRADLFYLRVCCGYLYRPCAHGLMALSRWECCLKHALAAMVARPNNNLHTEMLACAPLLQAYAWLCNARELRNLMQRVALLLAVEPLEAMTPAFALRQAAELGGSPPLDRRCPNR